VLPGHDAVIHCLGVGGHGNGRATTVVSEMTSHLVPAMIDTGVNRLIALSNIGAGSSVDQGPWAYRTLIRPVVLGIFLRWLRPIIEDKNRMESIIMASPLQWTIVRLPNVVDRPSRQSLRISTGRAAVGLSIGRSDLAEFLLAAVLLPASVKVAASVSN
jgi:nucleoside-diphosphate-sugar epimerase